MKILLDYEIEIDVQEQGKSKESFKVLFRELNSKEKKELKKKAKEYFALQKKLTKIGRKARTTDQKATVYRELKKFTEELQMIEELEAIDNELEKIEEKIEKLSGDEYVETESKKIFELCVSGPGAKKLAEHAEVQGYERIMQQLNKAKEGLLKEASTK